MLFWLVDGVVSSIVEIWVLGQWTKNNEEIVCLRSSLMDAMTPNISIENDLYRVIGTRRIRFLPQKDIKMDIFNRF